MRLAYVSADPGVPVYGTKGCSVHVQEVVRALRAEGAEVVLFTNRVGGEAPEDLRGVRVVELPKLPKGELSAREQAALASNEALRALLEQEGPFGAVYERYSLWSYAGMEAARAWGVPGLLEVNAPLLEEQREHRGLAHPERAAEVARRVFAAAATLLPVSQEVGRYLEGFAPPQKIHVVPNGVNPARFGVPRTPDPERFTVGFVGTLKPWHGVGVLLEAFSELQARVPHAQLLLVGSGPEEAPLKEAVHRRGIQGVTFTGAVAPKEIPALLGHMDVAVAPYPALPNFYFSPLKVYEYMAAGVPVVASRVGQLQDLLQDEMNGLLCPPGDAGALADALERLALDPDARERLAERGRETILRDHTWRGVARRILALIPQRAPARPLEVPA